MGKKKDLNLPWPQNILAAAWIEDKYGKTICELSDDQMDGLIYVLDKLTERERVSVYYRYQECMSYSRIAEISGVSVTRIQQIITKSINVLKDPENIDYIVFGLQKNEQYRKQEKEKIRNTENIENKISCLKKISIHKVGLSRRTRKVLEHANIATLGDIAEIIISDPINFIRIRDIGIKSVIDILSIMEEYGVDCREAKKAYNLI